MRALRMSFVVALFATGAFAQVHETITVEAVDVPVYVYNGSKPVQNLTRDDFELFVNGKPQPIDYFDRLDFTTTTSTAAAPVAEPARDPRDRRMFMLVFDRSTARPAALARARDAALAMVDHSGPSDYFAIVSLDVRNGAQFIIPFMKDRESVKTAIKQFVPRQDPLALSAAAITADAIRLANAGSLDAVMLETNEMPQKRMIADQMNDLAALADRLAVLEGYKHVVLFSEGLDPQLIFSHRIDPHLMDVYRDMTSAFRAAGAFVDAIDVSSSLRSTDRSDTLRAMSIDTGGQFIHWQNDLKVALAEISSTTSTVYRLGFKPQNAKQGDNTIAVKVRNLARNATVSYRRGFSTTQDYALESGYDVLRLADIVLNDIPQNGITASAAVEKRNLVITIPTKLLLASQDGLGVTADLLVYIFDKDGQAVDFVQTQAVLTPDKPEDVVIRQPLKVGPGDYVVKTLLRARKSIGFAKQTVSVAP